MARRELGPAALEVGQAVAEHWPGGDVVVGVSGGPDSMALALGAAWAARRMGGSVQAVVVDHQLQPGSQEVAAAVVTRLSAAGIPAEIRRVTVRAAGEGLEAAAREARLAALAEDGLPVLLGHTMDDQAEQVLLGLLRGSGSRAIAGIAPKRGPFIRPLLTVRRATILEACREWSIETWDDPMNVDDAFMRVKVRNWLASFKETTGRDVVEPLARTALLARADADLLDQLASDGNTSDSELAVAQLQARPEALRWRILKTWLEAHGASPTMEHVHAVDALVTDWHGQGPIDVPGSRVIRDAGMLRLLG